MAFHDGNEPWSHGSRPTSAGALRTAALHEDPPYRNHERRIRYVGDACACRGAHFPGSADRAEGFTAVLQGRGDEPAEPGFADRARGVVAAEVERALPAIRQRRVGRVDLLPENGAVIDPRF